MEIDRKTEAEVEKYIYKKTEIQRKRKKERKIKVGVNFY